MMLCFLFAALIVALDQFFKHWVLRTLEIGETGPELIPGILGLTRWENDGAMLNILSGQQWLLAGIAFVAAIALIMILLRYNEGFWGTLGLSAVLGGTVGNLIDRIVNEGRVVDMFRTLEFRFPIFNIADIFITLGFLTFLVHFIILTVKTGKQELPAPAPRVAEDEPNYDGFNDIEAIVAATSETEVAQPVTANPATTPVAPCAPVAPVAQVAPLTEDYSSLLDDIDVSTDTTPDISYTMESLEAELGDSLEDYNLDDILREYGIEDDDLNV
ncbi:MAG: signal peptidase II [Oscillospiraceae bacterium]|nr:signal peptidase II [Oscillospiraceae bacterium]